MESYADFELSGSSWKVKTEFAKIGKNNDAACVKIGNFALTFNYEKAIIILAVVVQHCCVILSEG